MRETLGCVAAIGLVALALVALLVFGIFVGEGWKAKAHAEEVEAQNETTQTQIRESEETKRQEALADLEERLAELRRQENLDQQNYDKWLLLFETEQNRTHIERLATLFAGMSNEEMIEFLQTMQRASTLMSPPEPTPVVQTQSQPRRGGLPNLLDNDTKLTIGLVCMAICAALVLGIPSLYVLQRLRY